MNEFEQAKKVYRLTSILSPFQLRAMAREVCVDCFSSLDKLKELQKEGRFAKIQKRTKNNIIRFDPPTPSPWGSNEAHQLFSWVRCALGTGPNGSLLEPLRAQNVWEKQIQSGRVTDQYLRQALKDILALPADSNYFPEEGDIEVWKYIHTLLNYCTGNKPVYSHAALVSHVPANKKVANWFDELFRRIAWTIVIVGGVSLFVFLCCICPPISLTSFLLIMIYLKMN